MWITRLIHSTQTFVDNHRHLSTRLSTKRKIRNVKIGDILRDFAQLSTYPQRFPKVDHF